MNFRLVQISFQKRLGSATNLYATVALLRAIHVLFLMDA